MVPAYFWGVPNGADLTNHLRFVQPFYDSIGNGNLVPAWLAESNNGFGDARFRFYPPLLYYVLSLFRLVTGDWYVAMLAAITLFAFIGAFGVYLWSRQNLSPNTALIASILFAIVPYHLAQFYQASLLGEYAATAFLPYAFMYVERLITNESGKLVNIGALAVSFCLIILTHLPTMVIGSLSLAIFGLILIDWKTKKATIFCLASAVGLGLVLSSWFWVKMIFELPWIQAGGEAYNAYYDYRNNFLFSPFTPPGLNTWYGSFVAVLTLGLFLPSVVVLRRIFSRSDFGVESERELSSTTGRAKRYLIATIILAAFSFLMTTELSRPIWAIVPKLEAVQFPYRWLAVTSVMICPVAALAIRAWYQRLRTRRIRPLHLPIILAFAVSIYFTIQNLVIESDFWPRTKFTAQLPEIRKAPSFDYWLPVGASEVKDLKQLDGQIDAGGRAVSASDIRPETRRFSIAEGNAVKVRLRTYYYPLWRASEVRSAKELTTSQDTDGTLLIDVPPQASEILVKFTEPTRTAISYFVSAIGWIAAFGFIVFGTFFDKRRLQSDTKPS